ncbi:YciI family protein [Agrococcus sp. 1P02AA]|uniref:YciI family protein n=1 Tax=Agrococcus sp. 1P02AA TaxID=3132259 RepID=UPI0039A4E1BF
MLIMRDEDAAATSRRDAPFQQMLERMGRYNAALAEAGVLVEAQGLAEPSAGLVVDFSADPPLVTDGPYGETKELFNGFWVLEVDSIEQAAEWAAQAPLGPGTKLEIRRVHGEADLQR